MLQGCPKTFMKPPAILSIIPCHMLCERSHYKPYIHIHYTPHTPPPKTPKRLHSPKTAAEIISLTHHKTCIKHLLNLF